MRKSSRLLCKQRVRGLSPLSSTFLATEPPETRSGGFLYPHWRQYLQDRVSLSSDHPHPEGLRCDFAWRSLGSRSVVGSGVLVVCGSGASRCRANWCCLSAVGCLVVVVVLRCGGMAC